MNETEGYLNGLYEKLYFMELENKDKINSRIQIVFGLEVAVLTIVTYIIKNASFDGSTFVSPIVIILSIIAMISLLWSLNLLKNAFWGNGFNYIPTPFDIDKYHSELIEYEDGYKDYSEKIGLDYKGEFDQREGILNYINDSFMNCASENMKVNELRSSQVYHSIRWLFISLIPLSLAILLFLSFDLDAASPRKSDPSKYIIITTTAIRV